MSALMRVTWPKLISDILPGREYGLQAEAYPDHSRRSLYFLDRLPPPKGLDGLTHFVTTERGNRLATIKEVDENFCPDRESSIWPVSEAAKRYGPPSERLKFLATPKPLCANYEFLRNCYTGVSDPAKRATATEHTRRLARSNPHKVWPSTDGYLDPGFTRAAVEVSEAAMRATCSPQLEVLAAFRPLDDDCQPERSLPLPVSPAALTATATPRLKKLSRPARSDAGGGDDGAFDEEAVYRVSVAAQNCKASRRTVELAVPVRIKGVRISLAQTA